MAFAKGAFSRHVMNRTKKKGRVAMFGSRRAYRRQIHSSGTRF